MITKTQDMLPKVNKADIVRTIEDIKEYLRSHHGIIRAPLPYIIMKTIIVQTYGDYPKYATPEDVMIVRMLQLTPDKNKLPLEHHVHLVKICTAAESPRR